MALWDSSYISGLLATILLGARKLACNFMAAAIYSLGLRRAGVAQLVEHLICNQRVGGSNPSASWVLRDRVSCGKTDGFLAIKALGLVSADTSLFCIATIP